MGLEKDRVLELTAPLPTYSLEELLADVRPSNLQGETDWGPPVGKEIW
jgi:antitoxin component of MazEF toxin-antitoxin module